MTSLAASDLAADRAKMTGTAEVQVTIVATVTVPTTAAGEWLNSDAVARAAAAANLGCAHYEAHRVDNTGAPDPLGDKAWTA